MANSVARVTEISAKSTQSFEDAVSTGVERATRTLRNVQSAWVKEMRVAVTDDQVSEYQVNLLITFELEG